MLVNVESSLQPEALFLFNEGHAKTASYQEYGEGTFDFLNRSTSPFSAACREKLESWFSAYPKDAQAQLRGRFRSDSEKDHIGSLFELYLHNMLASMGLTVEVEQAVSNGSKPDFLVSTADGRKLYIEAATIENTPENRHLLKVLNDINHELTSNNFFLSVDVNRRVTENSADKRVDQDIASLARRE